MHDLAELSFDAAAEADWSECPLVDARIEGWIAYRVKRADRSEGPGHLPQSGWVEEGAVGIAPGDWLLIAPASQREQMLAKATESSALAAEVSDALIVLDCGDRHAIFASLTGVDVAQFAAGHAAMTKLGGLPVLLMTGEGAAKLQLIFDASYARHMRAFLNKAQ